MSNVVSLSGRTPNRIYTDGMSSFEVDENSRISKFFVGLPSDKTSDKSIDFHYDNSSRVHYISPMTNCYLSLLYDNNNNVIKISKNGLASYDNLVYSGNVNTGIQNSNGDPLRYFDVRYYNTSKFTSQPVSVGVSSTMVSKGLSFYCKINSIGTPTAVIVSNSTETRTYGINISSGTIVLSSSSAVPFSVFSESPPTKIPNVEEKTSKLTASLGYLALFLIILTVGYVAYSCSGKKENKKIKQ